MEPDQYSQEEIRQRTEKALQRADVAGVFPTPLEQVALVAADIRDIVDVSDIPPDLARRKPKKLGVILGALGFRSRTIFLDRSQSDPRARWAFSHEIGHDLLPWHRDIAYFDDKARLFRDTYESLEREANLAAAGLLFQGDRFLQRALDYRHALATPIGLADDIGASIHATIRHYAERHPDPTGLIIAGRIVRPDGTVPIYCATQSRAFRDRYGPVTRILGVDRLQVTVPSDKLRAVTNVVARARASVDPERRTISTTDVNGDTTRLAVEAFDNHYNLFVMLTPHRRLRLGRRINLAA